MVERGLLIPVKKCHVRPERFTFGKAVSLVPAVPADRVPLGQLAEDLAELGVKVAAGAPPAVSIRRDAAIAQDEGYSLNIAPDGITIAARTDAGAYYAVQTLRDLLALHGKALPAMTIQDWPDLARRGVYHDCSRGKVPKLATLKQLVERLARWKINELQLYVENVFTFRSHPDIGAGYSPFTPGELIAVREHCKKHHVRFVGSLASFGHMEKILMLPAYRSLAEVSGPGDMGHRGTICPVDSRSIKLLADMYAEFVPLFEEKNFNVCCDETWEIGQGRSKRRCEKLGVGKVYLEFVLKLRRLCRQHGKRLNMWADIVLKHPEVMGEIPKDMVMLNWDYDANGSRIDRTGEIAALGLPQMCCPGTNGWQSHGTRMQRATANVSKFARLARKHKAEGLLNTDWGDFGHRNSLGASLHSFAHGGACAWSTEGVDDKDFTAGFCRVALGDRSGKLAEALTALGAADTGLLYHALVEPFDGQPVGGKGAFAREEHYSTRTAADRLAQVRAIRWPKAPPVAQFEQLALEEFALAGWMDELACRRLLAGRDMLKGKPIPAKTRSALAGEMGEMSAEFARLWRARNKPSRLADNLAAFKRAR